MLQVFQNSVNTLPAKRGKRESGEDENKIRGIWNL